MVQPDTTTICSQHSISRSIIKTTDAAPKSHLLSALVNAAKETLINSQSNCYILPKTPQMCENLFEVYKTYAF